MTAKELIKILRRFNRNAIVKVDGIDINTIYATVNQSNIWTVYIKSGEIENTNTEKIENSLDKEN